MAASFAAYASQYLNRQQNATSTLSDSSHPMFFSFTTDDGSRHGGHDTDVDDLDDPHLRDSAALSETVDDQDPYLRLDEDQHVGAHGHQRRQEQQQSAPLMSRSSSPESPPGWLAHLARSPGKTPSPVRSSSDDSSPPADLFMAAQPAARNTLAGARPLAPVPPPPRTGHSLSLTDSLLPRDGFNRSIDVFSLPDPRHTPRKRRKHHDAIWISLWLGFVTICVLFSIVILFTTRKPKEVPSVMLPYTVLLRTVPILVILTVLSAATAYVHVYLLRIFVKPVMFATSVFIPATLFMSAICAFIGSFMWDGDTEPTWGETVGLRLFAIIPLVLSLITARRLLHLPRQIHTTSSTLTLTTHLLIANPFLLALSPAILVIMLIGSIPFVTLIFRLLLVGYSTKIGQSSRFEWHVRAWANWAIVGAACIWFWSWAVARGILRMSCASVIGAWYFADPSAPVPPPMSTHTIHAALVRSTGPSLGSVVLASLILTLLRLVTLTALLLRRLPPLLLRIPWVPISVPIALYVIPGIQWLVIWLEAKSGTLSRYALIYGGLTGAGFWESAVRGRELVGGVEGLNGADGEEGQEEEEQEDRGRRGRTGGRRNNRPAPVVRKRNFGTEPTLALLTISPLTLSFPFALLTYLFVAHTIGAPNEAFGAALLAGGVTALVGLFCVGLVRDAADTLYLCYCIDKASGGKRREEVFIAFEYDSVPGSAPGTGPHSRRPEAVVHRPTVPVPVPSRKNEETLFDAEEVELGQGAPQQRKPASRPLPTPQQSQRGPRTTPLSPYLDADYEDMSTTPTGRVRGRKEPVKPPKIPEEEEDLDPFRRSTIDDEEAQIKMATRVNPVGIKSPTAVVAGHGPALVGVVGLADQGLAQHPGHRRMSSGGGVAKKMMTSTQELNMKSQFLMNMRPYGVEDSQSSEVEMNASASRVSSGLAGSRGEKRDEDDSLSDGEESQLGPGSDFFK